MAACVSRLLPRGFSRRLHWNGLFRDLRIPTYTLLASKKFISHRRYLCEQNGSNVSKPLGTIGESAKFHLVFTCKVCETRSTNLISKQAYSQGVVIVKCPGCNNNHLIADNLGWFNDEKRNIEDILAEKGEAAVKLSEGDTLQFFVQEAFNKLEAENKQPQESEEK